MKGEKQDTLKCLCDILLLLIINVGIVGALLEILEISWNVDLWNRAPADVVPAGNVVRAGLQGAGTLYGGVFWGGLFFFCAVAALLGNVRDRRRKIRCVGVCAMAYILSGVLFWGKLSAGLSLALQNAVENLNRRYSFLIVLPGAPLLREMERAGENPVWFATFGTLYVLIPFELLTAFLSWRGRCIYLVAGNVLWVMAACTCNIFPDYFFLIFCVLGLVAVLVQENFETQPAVEMRAVVLVMVIAGLVMGGIWYFLMPSLDEHYEALLEQREDFYEVVNGKWIPQIESLLPESRFGFGPGSDVTGNLNRRNIFAYTSSDMYRVTVSHIPQGALYLKGFVGGTYGESAWEAQSDRDFENYYQKNGLQLPRSYGDLQNISYEAAGAGWQAAGEHISAEGCDYISIEELGGRSSYSVYPYGARLTEDFLVHADGSVARRSREYQFQYRYMAGFGGENVLAEEWRTLEEQYRQYVYDNFLEYSPEKLPLLTERLEQADIRTGSLYECALDIMNFLDSQAVYDLDAGNNPSGTDFVEYFLFENQRGYCVHFASAAVLALRYFGIPARYVTGYTVSASGFSADGNGTYTAVLTGKQAHAWAEIYLDGIGWVPVEMTPGAVAFSGDSRMEQLTQLGRLAGEEHLIQAGHPTLGNPGSQRPEAGGAHSESLGERENPEPAEEFRGQNGRKESDLNADEDSRAAGVAEDGRVQVADHIEPAMGMQDEPGEIPAGTAGGTEGFFQGRIGGLVLILVAALTAAAALWALSETIWKRRRELWNRTLRTSGQGECIFLLYQNLRKALRTIGCPGQLAVDGEEFWHVLQETCPGVAREEYENFCRILEKNSFGNVEPTVEELERVRAMHDRLVEEVCRRVPFYRKRLFMTEGEKR